MININALTPQGIPTTSFADKAEELEKLLNEKTAIEEKVAENELAIQDFLHDYDLPKDIRETSDLLGLEDKLIVYLPLEKKSIEGLVYVAARAEGRAFSEIVSNPSLLKALEKKFGAKFGEFIREVDDIFHYKTVEKPREVDTVKTDELQKKYTVCTRALAKLKVHLRATEQKVANVDKYIAFCKSIVSLAPASTKGGGDNKQQGGQKPQG